LDDRPAGKPQTLGRIPPGPMLANLRPI
jgi:hypothetical protein